LFFKKIIIFLLYMNNQNLIIFNFKSLYVILKELEEHLNYKISESPNIKNLNDKIKSSKNYLIICKKKLNDIDNQFILDNLPIKISKLIEKINIQSLKLQFNEKSEFRIGQYKIDLNSRELILINNTLKLTEKETNIIIYLSQSSDPVSIDQLQFSVWGYQSKLETHTVETHIYRLRKKILKQFNDKNFILSDKNGYKIN
ncbi:winged helix-turn-helix domain-containing protein, partial [Candidatus Pelagibacter sp.]|nr:winged helix-turn-helix domain-containing protein [Candidatus Pelagibacter sp.]